MSGCDVMFRDEQDWISFGQSYLASEAFRVLFREGMSLVEETAAYLDGEGREESRLAPRETTLAYAGESMRLTTRLMQIASWLLVQRAVSEGEISAVQALEEKRRVKLTASEPALPDWSDAYGQLPDQLRDLVDRSRRLHARILHLDALICDDSPVPRTRQSPVAAQQGLLKSAFSAR